MRRRLVIALAFLLLLIPSAQFAWRQPRYAGLRAAARRCADVRVGAQGIAHGHGYRIGSLPENPYQTKYPPLVSGVLSRLVWHLNPHFPEQLGDSDAFSLALAGAVSGLACWLYRQYGFPPTQALLLTAALGLSPYMVLFGSLMLS